MGDYEVKSNEKQSSYTEIFNEFCPYFIAIGMSYDQFWFEDCWIAKTYLKAYKIKKEQYNERFWLQGMYIYEALCDVSPIIRAFSKKGTKPIPYSKEPYNLEGEKDFTEHDNEIERKKAENFFRDWASQVSKKFKKDK